LVGLLLGFLLPYQSRVWASMTAPGVVVDETLPVTAVMLFDTSLSMEYQQESQTRLEVARQIAQRHLNSLPRGSRVAICDTSSDAVVRFLPDLSAAVKRVAALTTTPVSRNVDDRLLSSIDAHLEDQQQLSPAAGTEVTAAETPTDTAIREVYVFSDLTGMAFRREASPRLKESLAALPGLGLYFIDVGIDSPSNVGVTELVMSEQSVALGSEVLLQARLDGVGSGLGEKIVEIYVENRAGKLTKQGAPQTVTVDGAGGATAQFTIRAAEGPLLQGEVRLLASDPLSFDDVRRFTLRVHPAAEILLVADVAADTRHVFDALSPAALVEVGRSPFRCRVIRPEQLATEKLSQASVVCLLNVSDPRDAGWKALAEYVEQGGSAAVVLGDRVKHAAYLTEPALRVLPGELGAALTFKPPEYLDLQNLNHPLLKRFDDWGASGLKAEPILKYWRVDPTRDTAVIARYTDPRQGPALIEKAVGKGRVLMLTTSLDRRGWNDLPVAGWEFVGLVDQMMTYLGRGSQTVYNHLAGEEVLLPLDLSQPLPGYLLRKPGQQQLKGEVTPGVPHLVVRDVDQLGNYRVNSSDPGVKYEQGFSVNADGRESNLTRLARIDLDERLGKDRYSVARDVEKLRRNVQTGRQGHEVFPCMSLLLLAIFLGEHLVANKFYDVERVPAQLDEQRQKNVG
ncbi:MAG: VWA domain-containing protein, partial [Planctomycetota bacterium]|nr:VWA domain-containing protein [Planctomycetota bacterium]